MIDRPRRNRVSPAIREFTAETRLTPHNLVLPAFVQEGNQVRDEISSMPGVCRLSPDELMKELSLAHSLGIRGTALFPVIDDALKDPYGKESLNPDGLLQRTIRQIKSEIPDMVVITDVALDPYSSDGHDGLVKDGEILNDETLPLLAGMAVEQARAGADIVAPSDMMDGRVMAIRDALDEEGFTKVGICSYCLKYASYFYGPFRDALDSAPRGGDKKTYQMDVRNHREGLREIQLDEAEGADWLLVKPGLPFLDIIRMARENSDLPIAAYHVSGEYAMLKAASEKGWLDYDQCLLESLMCMRRAGADILFTYGAIDAARLMQ